MAFHSDRAEKPRLSVPNDPVVDNTDRSRYTVRIVPSSNGEIKVLTNSSSKIKDRSGNLLQLNSTPAESIVVLYDTVSPTVQASPESETVYGDLRTVTHLITLVVWTAKAL